MDGAGVERIDAASMDILEQVGVQFRDPVALDDWKRAGAKVTGEMVHLAPGSRARVGRIDSVKLHLPCP